MRTTAEPGGVILDPSQGQNRWANHREQSSQKGRDIKKHHRLMRFWDAEELLFILGLSRVYAVFFTFCTVNLQILI